MEVLFEIPVTFTIWELVLFESLRYFMKAFCCDSGEVFELHQAKPNKILRAFTWAYDHFNHDLKKLFDLLEKKISFSETKPNVWIRMVSSNNALESPVAVYFSSKKDDLLLQTLFISGN